MSVVAGQAALRYSLMSPSQRAVFTTWRCLSGWSAASVATGGRWSSERWGRCVCVVAIDVVDDKPLEPATVPNDGAVEQLASQTADPAFREGVGYWGVDWGLENLEALATEDLVEVVDELAGAVTNEGSGLREPVGMTHEEVAGGLGGPGARRVGGDAAVEHFAVGDVDEEQQVAAAQHGGVDGHEVTSNGGLGAQELGPGNTLAAGRGRSRAV